MEARNVCLKWGFMVCINTVVRMLSRKMSLIGNVSRMGRKETSFTVYVWKPYGTGQFVRLRCRRECNVIMNLKEIGW